MENGNKNLIEKMNMNEDELRKSFAEENLNYDKIKSGAIAADRKHKEIGVYKENDPIPKSYRYPISRK